MKIGCAWQSFLTVAIAALVAGSLSCASDDGNGGTEESDASPVFDVSQSACVDEANKASTVERVRFAISDGVLGVVHENACRNCGFEVAVEATVGEGSLVIDESDVGENPAMCSCLHDVEFRVNGVTPGTWTIAWHSVEFGGDDHVLFEVSLDLAETEEHVFEVGAGSCV
ncbi:MAG: hypothetical protein IT350_02520 [Deltaproteobacteria bacterium]|nr:hypothetical protein [Deltaproteobacteria bacterium]